MQAKHAVTDFKTKLNLFILWLCAKTFAHSAHSHCQRLQKNSPALELAIISSVATTTCCCCCSSCRWKQVLCKPSCAQYM
jgi:hypothetical protein